MRSDLTQMIADRLTGNELSFYALRSGLCVATAGTLGVAGTFSMVSMPSEAGYA